MTKISAPERATAPAKLSVPNLRVAGNASRAFTEHLRAFSEFAGVTVEDERSFREQPAHRWAFNRCSTSERAGMDCAVPNLPTDKAAVAQPKRTASRGAAARQADGEAAVEGIAGAGGLDHRPDWKRGLVNQLVRLETARPARRA